MHVYSMMCVAFNLHNVYSVYKLSLKITCTKWTLYYQMDKCGSYSIQGQCLLMIETFTVMCWRIITFIHTTNSLHKPQHHQQQPPTNTEEDDILSFVEADNTHIYILRQSNETLL